MSKRAALDPDEFADYSPPWPYECIFLSSTSRTGPMAASLHTKVMSWKVKFCIWSARYWSSGSASLGCNQCLPKNFGFFNIGRWADSPWSATSSGAVRTPSALTASGWTRRAPHPHGRPSALTDDKKTKNGT